MHPPFLAATRPDRDATDLLTAFGTAAADEAAARADRSRRLGNHLSFCRWRQVGRLLAVLGSDGAAATLH